MRACECNPAHTRTHAPYVQKKRLAVCAQKKVGASRAREARCWRDARAAVRAGLRLGVHVYAHARMATYVRTRIYIFVYTRMCAHLFARTYVCTRTSAHARMFMHGRVVVYRGEAVMQSSKAAPRGNKPLKSVGYFLAAYFVVPSARYFREKG